jgi:tRNA(Ile)-lysidine synthase
MIDKKDIPGRFKRNPGETLSRIVNDTIVAFKMLEYGDRLLAGVSGGPDSVALVLSLLDLNEKYNLTLGIAHLNHRLRGEDSQRDEDFTRELAGRLGLAFHLEQADAKAHAKARGLSVEEAGRNMRYAFFEATAQTHGYTKIALGHTRDDNAELVLMNLLRGSGPRGISGIPPVRDKRYIRPLIRMSKHRLLEFLAAREQAYVVDETNQDTAYLRNRIRNQLIPLLQEQYNPEIVGALDRLSQILRTEDDWMESLTRKEFDHCRIRQEKNLVLFSLPLLSQLHPALLNRVLRQAVGAVKKNLKGISLAHTRSAVEFCFHSSSGASLDLPGQIRIYKKRGQILVKREDKGLRQIGKAEKLARQKGKNNHTKNRHQDR